MASPAGCLQLLQLLLRQSLTSTGTLRALTTYRPYTSLTSSSLLPQCLALMSLSVSVIISHICLCPSLWRCYEQKVSPKHSCCGIQCGVLIISRRFKKCLHHYQYTSSVRLYIVCDSRTLTRILKNNLVQTWLFYNVPQARVYRLNLVSWISWGVVFFARF